MLLPLLLSMTYNLVNMARPTTLLVMAVDQVWILSGVSFRQKMVVLTIEFLVAVRLTDLFVQNWREDTFNP